MRLLESAALAIAAGLLLSLSATAQTSTWNIDPVHSAIHFSVRHMVVSKTRGRFTKWSGEIRFDPQDPAASSVEVTIDPASIDTADAQRDAHLRSADFFDVEKYPSASFRSTKVELQGQDLWTLVHQQLVGAVEVEEGHSDLTMLRLHLLAESALAEVRCRRI